VFSSSRYLAEGDIIFFRTMQDKVVSHVGIYLANNMFINSSSSKGVSIANLQSSYWKTKYVACGRINISKLSSIGHQPSALTVADRY
jgi:lipoprotein Spr